ncbi:MAG TPA: site-specific DNA-methyltransferase [bacterium]|nr:site-specific DNA-methyltransferase [bacterium]
MAVNKQTVEKNYALYNGDCAEVLKTLPDDSIHLSVYSPPFCGLYHYSSSERDLSNCDSYEDFFKHYQYVVKELFRLTKKGRCTAVHCMDTPSGNSGCDNLVDFPGDIIRLHEKEGFKYIARHCIWKEPLTVRNRTMQKNLMHKTLVDDSIYCGVASADYLLIMRKDGDNDVPVTHETGMSYYAGEREIPADVLKYKNFDGNQIENRYSHWIWRQYASSFWDDIRLDNVLKYKAARDDKDEKHVHPLQLDVINRVIVLRTNPREVVLTPFMGVGSEIYGAVINDRKGIGIELKESYYNQAIKNLKGTKKELPEQELF